MQLTVELGSQMDDVVARHNRQSAVMRGWLEGKGFYNAARAHEYMRQLEQGVRKDSITPKSHHQLSVVRLLATLLPHFAYPETTLAAAFLHDAREDHVEVTHAFLVSEFGVGVADAVWVLSKKTPTLVKTPEAYFTALGKCPIGSLVKLADRAHNIQTMVGVFSLEKQKAYLEELNTWFFPMEKAARRNFPSQYQAYENLKILLRCQASLIGHLHEEMSEE